MTDEDDDGSVGGDRVRRSRRIWWIVAAVVVVLLAGGAVTAFLLLRESTTAVSEDEAVRDFRREEQAASSSAVATTVASTAPVATVSSSTVPGSTSPASTATTSTLPAPGSGVPDAGVYTYATTGRESIDALGGRSHRYPEESTITVTHEACGAVYRWRPLRERWDAMTVCPSPEGLQLRVDRNHHEFFGISDDRDFVCARGALLFPATTAAGTTWTARCHAEDVDVIRRGRIVGTTEVDVGGKPVTVLEFEVDDEISGASNGTTERTIQVVPDTGLIVGLRLVVDVRNDSPIGDVHYVERYEIRLTSLNPRR